MAEMDMELDSDYKLPLRPWLIRKLDKNEILNLKWLNMPERTLFKIPWNRQGQDPNWEKEYQLFKDWTLHRGKDPEELTWSKMKGNFRSVLNKSNDFEEVKERRVEDQQTGNYRVYRLLSHLEVKARTKQSNRQRQISKQSSSPSSQKGGISPTGHGECSTHGSSPGFVASTPHENRQNPTNQNQELSHPVMETSYNGLQSTYSLNQGQAMPSESPGYEHFNQETVVSSPNILAYPDMLECQAQTYPNLPQLNNLLLTPGSPDALENCEENNCLEQQPSAYQAQENEISHNMTAVEQALRLLELKKRCLLCYKVTLKYFGEVAKEEVLSDLSVALRMHHGIDLNQMYEAWIKEGNLRQFLEFKTWQFPAPTDDDKHLKTVLDGCDLGVIIRSDADGNIFITRLCKARIFIYKQDCSRDDIVKPQRGIETQIFCFQVFFNELMKYQRNEVANIPQGWVTIFFACQPHSRESNGIVSLTLTSKTAIKMRKHASKITLTQPEYSNSNSCDRLIRETSLMKLSQQ